MLGFEDFAIDDDVNKAGRFGAALPNLHSVDNKAGQLGIRRTFDTEAAQGASLWRHNVLSTQ